MPPKQKVDPKYQREIDALKLKNSQIEADLYERTFERDALQTEQQGLKESVKKYRDDAEKNRKALLDQKGGDLQTQINTKQAEIDKLKDEKTRIMQGQTFEKDQLAWEKSAVEAERNQLSAMVKKQREEVQERDRRLQELRLKLADVQDESRGHRKDKYATEMELQAVKDLHVKPKEDQVAHFKARLEGALTESSTRDKTMGELQEKVRLLQKELDQTSTASKEAARNAEAEVTRLTKSTLTLTQVAIKMGVAPEEGTMLDEAALITALDGLLAVKGSSEQMASDTTTAGARATELEARVAELEESLKTEESTVKELEEKLHQSNVQGEVTKQKLNTMEEQELGALQDQMSELQKQVVPGLEGQASDLQSKLETATKNAAKFEAQVEALENSLAEKEDQMATLKDEKKAAVEAKSEAEGNMKVVQAELAEKEATLKGFLEKLEVHSGDISAKGAKIALMEEKSATAEMRVVFREQQVEMLIKELEKERGKLRGREDLLQLLNQELATSRAELRTRQERIEEMSVTLRKTQLQLQSFEERNKFLEEKLDVAVIEMNGKEQRLEYLAQEIESSRNEAKMLTSQITMFDMKAKTAMERVREVEEASGTQQGGFNELQVKYDSTSQALNSMTEDYKRSQAMLRNADLEYHRLNLKMETSEEAVRTREQQLQLTNQKLEMSQQDMVAKERELAQSKREIADSELALKLQGAEQEPLRRELASKREELKQWKVKDKQIILLNEKLRTAEAEMKKMSEEVQLAKDKQRVAQREVENADKKQQLLQAEVDRRQENIEQLQSVVEEHEESIASLQAKDEMLEMQVEEAQATAQNIEEAVSQASEEKVAAAKAAATEEKNASRSRMVSGAFEKAALKGRITSKDDQIKELKQTVLEAQTQLEEAMATAAAEKKKEVAALLEQLNKAGLELKSQNDQMMEISKTMATVRSEMKLKDENAERLVHQYFVSTCLLVKMLLATRKKAQNVLAQDLYEEVVEKEVPIEEWPMYVHLRMSGGDPLDPLF